MKTYKDITGDGGSNIVEQVTAQIDRLTARLAAVKHIIAVMSGKGGVGKSTLTVNLASAMALEGYAVGIVDADINGPSIPKMTGVRETMLQKGESGVRPPKNSLNVRVMSMDLFLLDESSPVLWDAPTQKDAFTWRGMMEAAALRQFLSDTEWGDLDFLFLDLPPGAEKLPNILDVLPRLSGTIIVTIPSGVSKLVVGKSISLAKILPGVPLIGLVENMSAYVCAHCGKEEELFPGEAVEVLAGKHGVPFLGKIPFDPRIARLADEGQDFISRHGHTPAGKALKHIAGRVSDYLNHHQ